MTPEGRIRRRLALAYGRLGSRYPRAVALTVPQLALANVVLGVAILSLYTDMSLAEYLRITGVGLVGMFAYNLVYAAVARGRLRPVEAWLEGRRERDAAIEAWCVCAALPREMMRREWLSPLGALGYGGLASWTVFTAWELDLPALTSVLLLAGLSVLILYVQALRFLALEQALRPILDDVATQLGGGAETDVRGVPLRTRLLAALPAINVITGVTAVGIAAAGHGLELSDLGLAVVVSAAIAGTLSLPLTLLLSDSVTAPIEALHEATERVGRGDFAARVPVVTTDETGALARSFNEMSAGLEQRERLRDAFGTFVDPELTERVLEQGTDLAGEEVELSLLFMDVRGFTTYSERAEARDVVARLNDLYAQVVPIVLRRGGHANKFIGDGLLAVFGAPRRLADHADRAVAAALEIAWVVRERYRGELRVEIGVNTGRVVVGTIGGGGRLDFTVIGDAVNTAARVESATRETDDDVLITEATLGALSGEHGGWDERPRVALKGKTREVRLFGARALAEAAPGGRG